MGVEPDQPDLFTLLVIVRRDSGHRTNGDGVIASDDDREIPGVHAFFDFFGQAGTAVSDLVEKACLGIQGLPCLGSFHGHIAVVFEGVSHALHRFADSRDAYGAGAHVHTSMPSAQIHGYSDEGDVLSCGHGRLHRRKAMLLSERGLGGLPLELDGVSGLQVQPMGSVPISTGNFQEAPGVYQSQVLPMGNI